MGLSGSMDAWPPNFIDALAAHRRVITFDNEGIRRTTLGPGTLTIRLRIYRDAAHGFFPQHRPGFVRLVDRFLRSRPPR